MQKKMNLRFYMVRIMNQHRLLLKSQVVTKMEKLKEIEAFLHQGHLYEFF